MDDASLPQLANSPSAAQTIADIDLREGSTGSDMAVVKPELSTEDTTCEQTKQEALDDSSERENGSQDEDDTQTAVRAVVYPCTVRAGGATLAFCAGMVNAIAWHALNAFVSHLTGTLSKVGLGLEDSAHANAGDSMLLVVSFVAGSMLTGLLIANNTINIGLSLYDLCLLCESGLLTCATFSHKHKISRYLAAAACGLQNGMATHWGGAVIRTTHVTGLFTDVGLLLGRLISILCRKRCGAAFDDFDRVFVADDLSKLSVLFTIAVSFLIGVFSGAHCYNLIKELAFLIPAGITGCAGAVYAIYRVIILHQSFFSTAELDLESDLDLEVRSTCTRSTTRTVRTKTSAVKTDSGTSGGNGN